MENKFLKAAGKFYFVAIAVLMYYFLTQVINLGMFVTYRHAFALLLAASAFISFLWKPNIARGVATLKGTFVYCIPLIVTVVVSLFIWFVVQADADIIARGLSGAFVYTNMLSFTLAAVAFLYIFGEKGIWYNLIAILISNLLMILTIIKQFGFGSYMSEFIALVTSFAAETGDIIVQAEVHELAFSLGAYMIYMILKPKKSIVFFILFALTLFCFVSAFKRIGIIAIAIALIFGWLLKLVAKLKEDIARALAIILSIVLVVVFVGYIAIISMDAFTELEKMGIDTSGRVEIYDEVDKYYEFSPEFLGNGIGFLTYQLSNNNNV
ncbi:MAG: hypothetical protein IKV86_03080, partial [Clostridia bacterium]|nr:hypothetical protein [Clostridia bacterium]